MAFTETEEALLRELLANKDELLNLAGLETTIVSKLSSTKATLADLGTAPSLADADILLVRQGGTDKNVSALTLFNYIDGKLP